MQRIVSYFWIVREDALTHHSGCLKFKKTINGIKQGDRPSSRCLTALFFLKYMKCQNRFWYFI